MISGRGAYIAFEGARDSSKRAVAKGVTERLVHAHFTEEPDGTHLGSAIRQLTEEHHPTQRQALMLHAAARSAHYLEMVQPTLMKGHHILADRSVFSAVAYSDPLIVSPKEVFTAHQIALGTESVPDVVVYLNAPYDTLVDRAELSGNEPEPFLDRVVGRYHELASTRIFDTCWIVIDDSDAVKEEVLVDQVLAEILRLESLKQYHLVLRTNQGEPS